MTNTTQDLNSIRESNSRLFALKLNIEGIVSVTTEKRLCVSLKEDVGAGPFQIPPHPQRRCGVSPPDSSGARGYHHSAAPDRGQPVIVLPPAAPSWVFGCSGRRAARSESSRPAGRQ